MRNNNYSNVMDKSNTKEEIDLIGLLKNVWDNKRIIVATTTFFSIVAVIYSLSLPNIYESKALLSPINQDIGSSKPAGNVAGLASLAGIDISSASNSNSLKAISKAQTISFFKDNILPNIFLPDLMAVKSWDPETNTISYHSNKFDSESQSFISEPSVQKSYKKFKDIFQLSQDYDTGFVTVSIKHQSPYISQQWTNLVVNQINEFFRINDKREAQAAMDFLNVQMAQTSFNEIKLVIAQLLKNRMQQLTLIEANDFYIFSYLDPPMVMEEKIEPNRASLSILGAIFGALLSILFVISREFFITKKD
ncbi:Wzz/FepE/Etk N-terminal domain-containing protein [Gammaproteobacteria bacterium]|nr:Wzz/FepE/Etk N-terminal domain-containing protein [Gammaproteobacteria bacterium]